ncbi:hypothetical protein G9O61_00g002540 [Vairimorpha ceranae]|nr:hypothetical protein G9O61_00g002540 [Vairimorpha ceranae]
MSTNKNQSIEDILDLKENRMWFDICKSIPLIINNQNADEIWNIFFENILQYHPSSLTEAALHMSEFYSTEKSIELISKSLVAINDSQMYTGNFKMEIMHLEIKKCILLIEAGKFDDVESKIFEFKRIEMDIEVYKLYNFLAFKYYEITNNYEYCVRYIYEYLKISSNLCSSDMSLLELFAKYSLVSKNFFNFVEGSSLRGFNKINEDLYRAYIAVQEGNIELINKHKDMLDVIFGKKCYIVREKAYFIALINLCFKQEDRFLSFAIIQDELGISEDEIYGFLLKAFGLGLVKGWIDGYNKILHFNTIIPRCLPKDELIKMKNKVMEWKNKVRQAISMIE